MMIRKVRKYLLVGLGVLFPLFISLYIIYLLFSLSERFAGKYINNHLEEFYGFTIPGLGFLIIFAVVLVTGFVASRIIGRKLLSAFEFLIMKVPLVHYLYPSAKQLSDFLFRSERPEEFKKTVLVEFPYKGAYAVGFITNEDLGQLNEAVGHKLISVFIPLAPAPFSGFLQLVPQSHIKPLDISFETAIKYIVSGGVVFKNSTPKEEHHA